MSGPVRPCKSCGVAQPPKAFYRNPKGRDGMRPECTDCTKLRRQRWYAKNREREIQRVTEWQNDHRDHTRANLRDFRSRNPEYDREQHLRLTFSISIADYDAMLAKQNCGCAICGRRPTDRALHVDHDHKSGAIRGLLCVRCNNALGLLADSGDRLLAAVEYLASADPESQLVAELARARARELRTACV